ncbi:MAG TPA: cytochrome c peroxidase [Thiolinea sp.]|nr:cytochrome c peroxidase [Thiolinea sp.]
MRTAAALTCYLIISCNLSSCADKNTPLTNPWTPSEWSLIQSLSLAALPQAADPSNRYLNDPQAIHLGSQLFFDQRLSANGQISCASCHQPEKFFNDGLKTAQGIGTGTRNTPSILGAAWNQWFFWDGRKDSLWSQTLGPLENPNEHNLARTKLAKLMLTDTHYQPAYQAIFGQAPQADAIQAWPEDARPSGTIEQIKAWKALSEQQRLSIDTVFANTGKALAAYVSTLKPVASRFDQYVAALQAGKTDAQLNPSELAGLRLFIDPKQQCLNCHSGPLFTNQSFHNIGTGEIGKDTGRAAIIDQIRLDRFNCLGPFSDAPAESCTKLQYMQRNRHQLIGAYKTPTLRNLGNTAPYFHNGSKQTLADILDHYMHSTEIKAGRADLKPISLTTEEKQALIAFLNTLNAAKP